MVAEVLPSHHHAMQQQQQRRYSAMEERSMMQQQQHANIRDPDQFHGMEERAFHAAAAAAAAAAGFNAAGMDMSLANLGHNVQGLLSLQDHQSAASAQRKQREFIPDNKKDDSYWDRRRRNNEAAKRSREKRRLNDMVLEGRVLELTKENHILRAQLSAIRDKYGIMGDNLICIDQVIFLSIFNLKLINEK